MAQRAGDDPANSDHVFYVLIGRAQEGAGLKIVVRVQLEKAVPKAVRVVQRQKHAERAYEKMLIRFDILRARKIWLGKRGRSVIPGGG